MWSVKREGHTGGVLRLRVMQERCDDRGSCRMVSENRGSCRRVNGDRGSCRRMSEDRGSCWRVSEDRGLYRRGVKTEGHAGEV